MHIRAGIAIFVSTFLIVYLIIAALSEPKVIAWLSN